MTWTGTGTSITTSATIREGMYTLVETLRGMADAGTADWTAGTIVYWDDTQMQKVLDRHRFEFVREAAAPVVTYDGQGNSVYKVYWLPYQNLESGTAVFEVETADGATVSTGYSVDYQAGKITFTSNTAGTAYYITGRSYDINLAAADVWRIKASNASKQFDFSTDNHSIKRGNYVKNCLEMAQYYTAQAGIQVGEMERGDL